ncbi:hypothetical protein [Halobacterium rubrum]|uniref:hypothetical protein n=1 Tax=Halobacterium TaxID=2239 RepID=UPI001F15AB4B|nr:MULTISPECIES: hypothetical protein [Halobacterium]MDH5019245.1 hypothetical protein [Halobacterium rubrum]
MASGGIDFEGLLDVVMIALLGVLAYLIYTESRGGDISAVIDTVTELAMPFFLMLVLTFGVLKVLSGVS